MTRLDDGTSGIGAASDTTTHASRRLLRVQSSPSRHRPLRRAAVGATAIGALLLAACSGGTGTGSEAEGPVEGGTLVYASGDAEPTCLDPHVGGNYPQALVATQYLEQLTALDENREPVPWLAESWELAEDGLALDVTVRDDVTFTDGTPLTSEAVAANIAHLQDPETGSSTGYLALEKVEDVEEVDERTARIHLSEPDSALLENLAMPWLAIQSPAALERGMEENCAAPVGTGPFTVSEWNRQESIVLERNEEYTSPDPAAENTGPARLERIEWRFIPEAATRYSALASGEVHVIDNAQPDAISRAAEDDAIAHIDAPRPGASNRIELNAGQAPFDDDRVRTAFIRAAAVDEGIESLFFGTAERSYSALSSIERHVHADPAPFGTDLEEAAALLDEAGWTAGDDGVRTKDGERLTLRFPVSTNQSIPAEISLFEQIQAAVAEAGFDVQIQQLDLASWYEALAKNEYELVSAPYTRTGPDVLRVLYHSDGIEPAPSGYFANHAQLDDPQLDELLDEAARTEDETERGQLYRQAQEIILGGHYILPLYDQQNHFLHRAGLHGVRTLAVSTPTFVDAWLED
ncbi:ABC transporter substrate-binding protein [Sediminivirga luteola]|uniref:Peptide ABC transporter n=1 Tax=Sediminivirga luteola TaxID=1774748 RepID=A0A8J2XLN4_9MICO|nr:ABC transporter substrate-binding protein [Sediminivirga luteola]GGA23503.1 peptide ABC transporter [Sediminivirga luteola]